MLYSVKSTGGGWWTCGLDCSEGCEIAMLVLSPFMIVSFSSVSFKTGEDSGDLEGRDDRGAAFGDWSRKAGTTRFLLLMIGFFIVTGR